MTVATSLPAMLLRQASERGSSTALRHRHSGAWKETTWRQFAQRTAQVGLALAELGIAPGDRVAVHASDRPDWLSADLAIQGIGAVPVAIASGAPAPDVAYRLSHSEARVLFAEDEHSLDDAIAVRDWLPALERIVLMNPGSVPDLADRTVESFSDLVAAVPPRNAVEEWASHVERLDPDSVASIVYTAGTTDAPKGAMLTHANLAWAAGLSARVLDARRNERIHCALALSHPTARIVAVGAALEAGSVVSLRSDGEDAFTEDLRGTSPAIVVAAPAAWEAFHARVAERAPAGADQPLRRGLRKELGVGRLRAALAAGGPVAPPVLERLRALNLEVRELYALAEAAGICALAPPGEGRPGTVGRALAAVELRTVADGEVQVRSSGVFAGYFRDQPATDEAIDSAGWLNTGDLGTFETDGFLTITGRKHGLDPQ